MKLLTYSYKRIGQDWQYRTIVINSTTEQWVLEQQKRDDRDFEFAVIWTSEPIDHLIGEELEEYGL